MGLHEGNDHNDHIEDAVIENGEENSTASLMVLSSLNPNNLEDRVRIAAKEMAKRIYESKAENIDNINQIVVATAAKIASNKTEGMVFLYVIVQEIAALDKTGEIASLFLQKGVIKKVYNHYGNSIDDSYRNGVYALQVLNSKAYLIDAFITDFFPLYSYGELAVNHGMTGELLYQDKFLNIFFRAVKSCFENDKVMGVEVLRHQAMLATTPPNEDQSQIQSIIENVFERETNRVLGLFQQSDKVKIQTFLEGKIDELLKLAGKSHNGGGEDPEMSKSFQELSSKIDLLMERDPLESPEGTFALLQKIDRNVVAIIEGQLLLRKRVEEITEPATDFLSDALPKNLSGQNEPLRREDVMEEIRGLAETVEKMFISLKDIESKKTPTSDQQTDELPMDDPMVIFGSMTQTMTNEEPSPAAIHESPSIDMDALSRVIELAIGKALVSISDELSTVRTKIGAMEDRINEIAKVGTETNSLLKEEINSTNEFIANMKKEQ